MTLKSILGQNIVTVRKEKNITQQNLATMAGISVSHLRSIEHGKGNTTVDIIERVSSCLKIQPYSLLRTAPIPAKKYKRCYRMYTIFYDSYKLEDQSYIGYGILCDGLVIADITTDRPKLG
ncbi:helix-turn-helix transcriptional regulator, partial [Ligaoa zhengdingensis]